MKYKPIPQYPNYVVSRCGNSIINTNTQRELVQGMQTKNSKPTGYKYVTILIRKGEYECKRIAVHRLVCFAWHGPPPEGKPWVNHKNGIRMDNDADNLEWSSISDNIQHSFDVLGRKAPSGPDHYNYGKRANKETRVKISIGKIGKLHPKYKGFYSIFGKKYYSAGEAGKVMNVSGITIIRRCNNPDIKDYTLVPDPDRIF